MSAGVPYRCGIVLISKSEIHEAPLHNRHANHCGPAECAQLWHREPQTDGPHPALERSFDYIIFRGQTSRPARLRDTHPEAAAPRLPRRLPRHLPRRLPRRRRRAGAAGWLRPRGVRTRTPPRPRPAAAGAKPRRPAAAKGAATARCAMAARNRAWRHVNTRATAGATSAPTPDDDLISRRCSPASTRWPSRTRPTRSRPARPTTRAHLSSTRSTRRSRGTTSQGTAVPRGEEGGRRDICEELIVGQRGGRGRQSRQRQGGGKGGAGGRENGDVGKGKGRGGPWRRRSRRRRQQGGDRTRAGWQRQRWQGGDRAAGRQGRGQGRGRRRRRPRKKEAARARIRSATWPSPRARPMAAPSLVGRRLAVRRPRRVQGERPSGRHVTSRSDKRLADPLVDFDQWLVHRGSATLSSSRTSRS